MSDHSSRNFSAGDIFRNALRALPFGLLLAAVLIPLFAAVSLCAEDPIPLAAALGRVSLMLVAPALGIAAARFSGTSPVVCALSGALSGVLFLLPTAALSLLPIPEAGGSFGTGFFLSLSLPLLSCVFALTARRRERRHRRRRRR